MTVIEPDAIIDFPKRRPTMRDMSPQISDIRNRRRKEDAAVYYSVFGILFVFAFVAFAISRLIGRPVEGSLFAAAKRAADVPAGYAIKC